MIVCFRSQWTYTPLPLKKETPGDSSYQRTYNSKNWLCSIFKWPDLFFILLFLLFVIVYCANIKYSDRMTMSACMWVFVSCIGQFDFSIERQCANCHNDRFKFNGWNRFLIKISSSALRLTNETSTAIQLWYVIYLYMTSIHAISFSTCRPIGNSWFIFGSVCFFLFVSLSHAHVNRTFRHAMQSNSSFRMIFILGIVILPILKITVYPNGLINFTRFWIDCKREQ